MSEPTGRSAGAMASAASLLLAPLTPLYAAAIAARNAYFDRRRAAVLRVSRPVVSIGNLSVGGTGKTPLVICLVRMLLAGGRAPAIVTRGYAAVRGGEADEVLELRAALPGVPVVVSPDRVAGAERAIAAGSNCIVLDDGFQHRRLARDLDIVVIDALDPWGAGRLLPAGRLREPLHALRRAQLVVISRANQVPAAALEGIRARVRQIAADLPQLSAVTRVDDLLLADGGCAPSSTLSNCPIVAVCGLGNPHTFLKSLDELGALRRETLCLPDHHRYRRQDVRRILAAAEASAAELVVTTAKDWVKLRGLLAAAPSGSAPSFACLRVRAVLQDDLGVLDGLLGALR